MKDEEEYKKFKRGFALRLRLIAANRDLKYKTIADEAGIEPTHIYKYVHSESLPGAYHLAKLATSLGVSADHLLGIEGDAQ